MSTISVNTPRTRLLAGRRLRRLAAVTATLAGTLGVWLIATAAFGVELRAPAFDASAGNPEIGPATVAFATLAGAIAGWAALAAAERLFGGRGRRIWLVAALLALLLSLGGPFSGTGVSEANRLILASMHVVAAAILVPLLYRSSRPRDGA